MNFGIFVSLVLVVWFVAALGILFKKDIHWSQKLAICLLCAFYGLLYKAELQHSWQVLQTGDQDHFITILHSLLNLFPVILLLIWPLELWRVLRIPSQIAEKRLRFLILLTLFYWLFWMSSAWFGISFNDLMQEIPKFSNLPKLPQPPIEN